jgi:hypothetical protein
LQQAGGVRQVVVAAEASEPASKFSVRDSQGKFVVEEELEVGL